MEIVNPGAEDYHIHSSNFSDGLMTIEEIVQHAGKIGLTKIAITDHSQAVCDEYDYAGKGNRDSLKRWRNVHNDTEVIWGVEGDILDARGNICRDIQGKNGDFLILSAHPKVYKGNPKKITQAYIKAIENHVGVINVIGHPCANYFAEFVNIDEVVQAANEHHVALELNGANLYRRKTDIHKLDQMLRLAERIYVNSDAHTLYEMAVARAAGFNYLKKQIPKK